MKQLSETIKQVDERISDLDATAARVPAHHSKYPSTRACLMAKGAEGNEEVRRWGTAPNI